VGPLAHEYPLHPRGLQARQRIPERRGSARHGAAQRPPRRRRPARLDLQRHADRGGEAARRVHEGVRGEAGVTASSVAAAQRGGDMNVQRGRRAVLAALLALIAADAAAALTAAERQIVAAVKERSGAALQFLERTVNVNSGTLNPEGVREVGRMFRAEFDQLGFTTRWVDLPPAMQRAGHLVAAREGKQGKRLLLIGHLDTVFEKDSPVQRWERKGDRIRGPGVSDMKGGDVIIVEALRALAKLHALDNTSITIVFTGDEEKPGSPLEVTRAELVSAAKRSDLTLGFEGIVKDREGRDTATIGR